jgi:D-beta-D-heptose 7-phosphate kinase/D-beta-D-heptose 1-phosphate adenosyltransferase
MTLTPLHLPDFNAARVLVVGDVMLDRYWHGPASRISPEAPVPVLKVEEVEERVGGAGNVALNIVALGAQAVLLGVTGNDEAADSLERLLHSNAVDCHLHRLENVPTVTKLRVMSRHQQLMRLDFEDGFEQLDAAGFEQLFRHHLDDADVIVFSDYGKGTLRDIPSLISIARQAGKQVLVDPKGNDYAPYHHASLITPNLSEFEAVTGRSHNDEELTARGEQLRQQLELDALLVTRSERGMTLFQTGAEPLHFSAQAREVYDVTGAGDTVIAVLAASLAAGHDLSRATAMANLAAGIVVGKMGTATVNVNELRRALRERDETERGIMPEDELLLAIQDARAHSETVVMTNGCFDILHSGHVSYLEKARRLGDRLIVAVNDDASVKRLKGEQRPVNTLEHRMHVLSALQCVDWVVSFSEDTPERLVCKLLPDMLVKGGDYKPEDIAGGRCVTDNGGSVEVLEYVDGCSTTEMIENIKSR